MKKLHVIILSICILSFTGCNLPVAADRFQAMQTAFNEQKVRADELQAELDALKEQYSALEGNVSNAENTSPTDPLDEKILGSLFLRPDLIPVGDEDMRYFTELCRVLGDHYVYAYAEDGRHTADMILSYSLREDTTYEWSLEIYNTGTGWQLSSDSTSMDPSTVMSAPTASDEKSVSSSTPATSSVPASSSATSSKEASSSSQATTSSQAPASSAPSVSKPTVSKPIPNEAQQQKFREIASLVQ